MSNAEWSYTGANGPEHWHTLCNRFAIDADFKWQSPVPLAKTGVEEEKLGNVLAFHYQEERFIEQNFNHTFHFIPPEKQSYVVFDREKYHLTDIHFHLPSEHVLEAKQYPIEFHFVHMNARGHNLVVGVLFDLKGDTLLDLSKFQWCQEQHQAFFQPEIFIPKHKSFYHYVGSLTTPPTRGPIDWFVFDQVVRLPEAFVTALKKDIMPNNNRPLQDLKGRKVWHN